MLECEKEKEERINKNPPPSFVFLGGGCHFLFFWSSVKLLNEQNYRRECEIMPKSKEEAQLMGNKVCSLPLLAAN